MRRTTFLLAFAVSLLSAQQNAAPTSTPITLESINHSLPKWLSFGGEYRMRAEGFTNGGYRDNNDDLYALSRLRLNMKVQPASWMKFNFQAQDARVWGKNQKPPAPPFQDSMDLRLAYIELGDPEKKTFSIRAGRQELVYGEQRLLGHVGWLNTARSFDAALATIRYGSVRVDAFSASVVNARDGEFNHHSDGNNIHGLYGRIGKLVPKSTVEPYVLWRVGRGIRSELGLAGRQDFFTYGFRLAGPLPQSFDYSVEVAMQRGTFSADEISAWAGHWRLGRTLPKLAWKPRLIAEYQYASGDGNPRDGKKGTFDQLYPTPHDKIGLADQVGWRNVQHIRVGAEFKATKKLMLTPNYHSIWLASRFDGLYSVAGAVVARSVAGTAGRHVGQEIDLQVTYPIAKYVQLAGGYAFLFAGEFLKNTTPGKNYSFPYVQLLYTF